MMLKLNLTKQLPLLNQSISSVHRLLQNGELTAVDLVEATLQRIKSTAALNAFITVPEEVARQQALLSAQRFSKGQSLGILDGIPISFKDNFSTKGVSTTCASKMLSKYVPPFNATVVERLLDDSGVVLMGKTNMDEFAMGSACSESYFGPTYNPWQSGLKFKLCDRTSSTTNSLPVSDHPEEWFIPGGSSGGSAVSVAIGASFAALSSDTGGSTRNPASRVGIVGFKPTYGLISRFGLIPLTHSLDVPGVMARSVEDVTAVFGRLHGVDHRDSTTVDVCLPINQPEKSQLLKDLTIGISEEYRPSYLDTSIATAWDETIQLLINAGARIQPVSLPHTKYSLPVYSILNTAEVASNFACYDGIEYGHRTPREGLTFEDQYTATREEAFNDIVKARIIAGNYFLLSENYEKYYEKALRLRRLIAEDFRRVFETDEKKVDFLLTPVTVTGTMNYREWSRMDKTEEAIKEDYCTQPANMAGLPAISLPVKVDKESGLPIGLQLVGAKFDDYRLLRVAGQLEELLRFPHLLFDLEDQ